MKERGYVNLRDQGLYLHVILKNFPCFGGVQKSSQTGSTLNMVVNKLQFLSCPSNSSTQNSSCPIPQLTRWQSSPPSFVQMTSELDFFLA